MTVIAWDGKVIAADKQENYSNMRRYTTKLIQVADAIVGFAGNTAIGNEVVDWFIRGAVPEKFPPQARDRDDYVNFITVLSTGVVMEYTRSPFPHCITDRMAIGSGRDFAVTAMYLGRGAREAVEIASVFDVNCGNGADAYILENQTWRKL